MIQVAITKKVKQIFSKPFSKIIENLRKPFGPESYRCELKLNFFYIISEL